MATSSKKAGAARKRSRKTRAYSTDPHYVELRTLLDSLEIGALRFYLNDTNASQKEQNFKKLKPELMYIINQVWGRDREITCPRGYTECDGACVPYSCP